MKNILSIGLLISLFACHSPNDPEEEYVDESRLIKVNGTELFVKLKGSGDPLLVIHGGPLLDHTYLAPFLDPLSKDHLLIFYDQRLSGRSSGEVDSTSVNFKTFVEDINALLDTLNVGKVNILGHSWGGLIAMKYAESHTDRLNKLILSNPIPPTTAMWQEESMMLNNNMSREDSLELARITSSAEFQNREIGAIEKMMEASLSHQFYDRTKAQKLQINFPQDYIYRSQQFGYMMSDLSDFNMIPAMAQLEVPTLILYGEMEPSAKISGRLLADTIPESDLYIFKKSGHFPFIESQDEFLEVVNRFLQ